MTQVLIICLKCCFGCTAHCDENFVTNIKEDRQIEEVILEYWLLATLDFSRMRQYIYIIVQARSQDGWVLAEFSFCFFMQKKKKKCIKMQKENEANIQPS